MRPYLQLVIPSLLLFCGSLCAQDPRVADDKPTQQVPAHSQTECHGAVEILSNTMGVDFRHYTKGIVKRVRQHWYKVMPQVAGPPVSKRGVVAVEFVVEKDGQVTASQIVTSSGDESLDSAALTGFTASTPFPRLPSKFGGEHIAIRFCFFYNPDKSEISKQ